MVNTLNSYNYITYIVAFSLAVIGLFAPLAMVPVFIIISLYPSYLIIKNSALKDAFVNSRVNKIIALCLTYALISSIWALQPQESLHLWVRMLLIFVGCMALFTYAPAQFESSDKVLKSLLLGILIALAVANIEIFSEGAISKFFGVFYKVSHKFELVIFNRGASIFSIMCWPLVCYLLLQKRYKAALGFMLLVLFTIVRLDSLSSVVGMLIGSVVFALVYWQGQKVLKILAIAAFCGVFVVVIIASMMDVNKIIATTPAVPGAASNMRLHIWSYTAKQAEKKPFIGYGFNSSRSYPVDKSDYVDGGRSPLPLHPHNNVLQVWLELGAIGLILFAAFLSSGLWQIAVMDVSPLIRAGFAGLFTDYFVMGETGYGLWQNWWVCSGILAAYFLHLAKNYQLNNRSL